MSDVTVRCEANYPDPGFVYPAYSARTWYRVRYKSVALTSPVPLLPLVPGDVVMTTLPGPCYLLPPSRLLCSV